MEKLPSKQLIETCLTDENWGLGNEVLYDLCKKYPKHTEKGEIIAKVWIIGRAYAAIERFKKHIGSADNNLFYTRDIPILFIKSDLDNKLKQLRVLGQINKETLVKSLNVHCYLIDELKTITNGQIKRSFCSKYLHFHLPEMFFIYDSIAASSIGKLKIKIPAELKSILERVDVERQYADFCIKCLCLKIKIKEDFNIDLSNRQLDNLLLNPEIHVDCPKLF
jgi:hypothetical protein